ncbi:hypothetical protein G7Y89_g8101 [Cudoniella acicularis]|uniref:VPS9 domain-containing protein n=1 Tax=Cudoniella acicularis TaxID=354080 RepID=A0A8H4RJ95_9HELO|nr:hypothetical protein G7Y89_g8101 [Cudoniella acicularis]
MQAISDKMLFTLPDFMASAHGKKSESQRPRPLHSSRSFSKLEPSTPDRIARAQRASTIQNGVMSDSSLSDKSNRDRMSVRQPDAFEKAPEDNDDTSRVSEKLPADFDELPIELVSLTDSFIDSLSAKVHPTPPTVDKLSSLFQDFYAVAATHISTHISALSSRQHRENSPAPSVSSLSSTASKLRAKAVSISNKDRPKLAPERRESEQQMLTVDEIADRKRARRVLEQKRVALEEVVERRVCERIYDRIFRHRSTQDEAQDEKLRSKTAALSVVGIGLTDLGIDLGLANHDPESMEAKETEVREWLEGARVELIAMNDEKFPLGKLQHLKAAHKSIVDTLSHFHPSSSADEIMPMLIYTLITSRPEGISVISNLYFIQRFRNEGKIDGEAAYCLTNLEAAITFLETVDLASLRADENPAGPGKSNSRPTTPKQEKIDQMALRLTPSPGLSTPEVSSVVASPTTMKPPASPSNLRPSIQVHNRRISDMFQPPAVLGAAGDAVLNTADQGFKTIGSSLGDSYKFLLGKLKERQDETSGNSTEIIVPKTLDDARKLVSTPPPEEEGSVSGTSSLHSPENTRRDRSDSASKPDDKLLNLIGGRKMTRDRSTDSNRSSGSNKKVAFAEEGGEKSPMPSPLQNSAPVSSNPAIVESMRNLGNTLNPMTRIAGMGMMRGFGRATPAPTPAASSSSKSIPDGGVADLTTTFPELAPVLPPKEIPKIAPPIKKFMELQNPGDMKLNEVTTAGVQNFEQSVTAQHSESANISPCPETLAQSDGPLSQAAELSLPLLRGRVTMAEAIEEEENMIIRLAYPNQRFEFFLWLMGNRKDFEALVSHQLGLSSSSGEICRFGEVGEWRHGSFNVCIPIYIDNWRRHPGKRLLLRIPLPYKVGESTCPGNANEKLRTEAATFIWIQNNCPDVPTPGLWGFGFPGGQSYHSMENEGTPTNIGRSLTYTTTDVYYNDLLACHDSRIRNQPNSILDEKDGQAQMATLFTMRSLLSHFIDRRLREGPFAFTLTDLHGIDKLEGDELEKYQSVHQQFVDIFAEEEKSTPAAYGTTYRADMMRRGWKTRSFWYFHALRSPKEPYNLFWQHLHPIFKQIQDSTEPDVGGLCVEKLSEVVALYWDRGALSLIETKLKDKQKYEQELERLFKKDILGS